MTLPSRLCSRILLTPLARRVWTDHGRAMKEARQSLALLMGLGLIVLAKLPGWNLVNEGGVMKLHRAWKVKTFVKGMEFLQLVADVAEAEGHHPDLHLVGWNNIKIDIWTHAVGGLTENDFILAAKINGLNLHHLLRITPANK
ncbi:Pterin-4-alpha-carbinolamine dehydratase 2, mitochondrial [Sesamum alatum]|uniref:4a-hydroxytetrahydrobiopterin dehydratase n=1 Tax=Sesamum alatum TaxID=300844 RepID=A0AAE1Y008_9LAMI|nr:Pterin-4-alpha-carbinolamine dehydratase 2, mitochondrial [Sesamum alatum]